MFVATLCCKHSSELPGGINKLIFVLEKNQSCDPNLPFTAELSDHRLVLLVLKLSSLIFLLSGFIHLSVYYRM